MQLWPFNRETAGGRPGASPELINERERETATPIFEANPALKQSVDTESSSWTINMVKRG